MSTRGSDASLTRPPSRSSKPANPSSATASASPHTVSEYGLSFQSRKRKRDSPVLPMEELLKPLITIKPQFSLSAASNRPLILRPLMLLSREHLTLSSLDLSAPNGEFASGPGRFFESHIRILDLEGRLRQAPSVLIARSDSTRKVYAIERHQNGLYVVCKLGSWVNIEELSQLAEACYAPRCRLAQTSDPVTTDVAHTTPQLHKENKKKRLAIEELQSMVRKRPRTVSVAPHEAQHTQSEAPVAPLNGSQAVSSSARLQQPTPDASSSLPLPQPSQPAAVDSNADLQTSAADIFSSIRTQYFEALYHSKGSLAYFAKGPLSRARAAFHLDCDGNLDMNDLVEFLKSLVILPANMDKKYKETVPELISQMKISIDSSGEDESKPKRRKPKKMKVGKDGLYPGETDNVKKWWNANKPDVRDDDDSPINPQEIKYHISCLRTRETQLQIIIILEILALESVRPAQEDEESQLPGMPAEDPLRNSIVQKAPKKRSKLNLPMLVEIHADRMCIWQSTTLDEMNMIAAESQAKIGDGPEKSDRADSDPLRDFCIDIIMPFFAGRLPELTVTLNQKFGGPVVTSPPKPKRPVASTAKTSAKPGSAAKRPLPSSAPKSLEKVFESDQQKWKASRRPVDVLARMRSATPATIPGLKREGSEPLGLGNIPRGDKSLKERSRNVLSKSASSGSGRVPEESKAQKKAKEEAELKEAISALKKPNRTLAGRSIVDEAEKRMGSSSSPHPRKQRKPVRNAAAASRVQVKATPANARFKDAISSKSQNYTSLNLPQYRRELDTIPSSSSVVPATAPRNGFRDDLRDDLAAFHIASTPHKSLVSPARAKARAVDFAQPSTIDDAFIPPSSPIISRNAMPAPQIPHTRRATDLVAAATPSSPVLPRLFKTPIKHRPLHEEDETITSTPPGPVRNSNVVFATPAKKVPPTSVPARDETAHDQIKDSNSNETSSLSIFQRLGWNYDDLDDLA